MKLSLLFRHARTAYPMRDYLRQSDVRHLRRGYVRARIYLGDAWILAKKAARKAHQKRDAIVCAVASAGAVPIILHDLAVKLSG